MTDSESALLLARRRYEVLRILLGTVLVVVVLASLGLGLLQGQEIAKVVKANGEQVTEARVQADLAKAQADQVADLLERQKQTDGDREQVVNEAIARITAEQRRALVAHDRRTEELLRRTLGLVGKVGPGSSVVYGPPTGVTARPAAKPAPSPTRTAAPAPAPAPSPCDARGKSGRCK